MKVRREGGSRFLGLRKSLTKWRGDEGGAAAVTVAMLLVALMGLSALAVDIGWLFAVRGEIQNAADTGALAGAVDLAMVGQAEAKTTAVTYATHQSNFLLTKSTPGAGDVGVTFPGPDRVRVEVGPTQEPTIFARVWGTQTADVRAVAVAKMERKIIGSGPGNLLPFGLKKSLVDPDDDGYGDDIGQTRDFPLDPKSPGNFGLLDLNGGSNSNSETKDWIENGYDDTFIIPEDKGYIKVEGDPGLSGNSLSKAISKRVGEPVLFPVFSQVTGQGANTSFWVVDFVGGIIQSYQLTGNDKKITIEIVEYSSPNLIVSEDENATENSSVSTPVLIQ